MKRIVLAAAVGGVATMAVPATAALAINRATPCPRSDFVQVTTSLNYHHCFANAGVMSVTINDAKVFRSGNNTVKFSFSDGNALTLTPNVQWPPFSPTKTVTRITIY
ncbi:beta/gamma crystallin domain-containing protein [Actinoplanes teichomyceticus]|uniref:beta/gamma crystallin domain-containing protein n=1 Tax=Actinoplanes teichomyceticus TaxID=1867 RepID=UPI0013DDD9F3|nr:beta/gamma crystallin domain-containing protein [Actinoplanes teichomyceticus]